MGQVKKNKFFNPGVSSVYEIKGKGWYHGKKYDSFKRQFGGVREHLDTGYYIFLNSKTNDNLNTALKEANKEFVTEVYKRVLPYIPYDTGALQSSLKGISKNTSVLEMTGPYVRYMYYGEVYGPNFAKLDSNGNLIGFRSPKHKHPTGRPIQYNTAHSPKAGPYWFDRMKADEKDDLLAFMKRDLYRRGYPCK